MPWPLFAPPIAADVVPSIVSVVISDQNQGECAKAQKLTHRVTVTFDGPVSSAYDIRFKYCYAGSGGCSPSYIDYLDGDGSTSYYYDMEHDGVDFSEEFANILGSGGSGTGPDDWYFNAEVELVATGTSTPVLDSDSATQHYHSLYTCGAA